MNKIDVVVPTLMRKSLPYCLQAIREVIPIGSIILITDKVKGVKIGALRNKGLAKTISEYVAFIDDDAIVNKDWFSKIMNYFESHPDVILVGGKYKHGYTIGCLIVKAEPFKWMGGFTESDVHLQERYGSKSVTLEDAICEHMVDKLDMVFKQFRFLTMDFQTESKTGLHTHPKEALKDFFRFLYWKQPEVAITRPLWIIKSVFCLPFTLEEKWMK